LYRAGVGASYLLTSANAAHSPLDRRGARDGLPAADAPNPLQTTDFG
jgi:hypothetical protein